MKTAFILIVFLILSQYTVFAQAESNNQSDQNKYFFRGEHLDNHYQFKFPQKFEELNLLTEDSFHLNALLFKAPAFIFQGDKYKLISYSAFLNKLIKPGNSLLTFPVSDLKLIEPNHSLVAGTNYVLSNLNQSLLIDSPIRYKF